MKASHHHSESQSPTFLNLFLHTLRDLFSAEQQLIQTLPAVIKAIEDSELKETVQHHLKETRHQVTRLKKIFSLLREDPEGVFCKGMHGLIEEAHELFKKKTHSPVKDAALIAALQRVEHYEIAVYGTARAYAKQLGYSDIADLLDETLDEEAGADKALSKLAVGGIFTRGINQEAEETELARGRR